MKQLPDVLYLAKGVAVIAARFNIVKGAILLLAVWMDAATKRRA